jgi:hypothetical protein
MTLQEAKAIVLVKHRNAWCMLAGDYKTPSQRLYISAPPKQILGGRCRTEKAAWLSAARRIQAQARRIA